MSIITTNNKIASCLAMTTNTNYTNLHELKKSNVKGATDAQLKKAEDKPTIPQNPKPTTYNS